ncbi:hypothetical protein GQ600_6914 [Phytophthora cactorum]|nr:hypothetical protein GQ600_6914 [Phytophthora cactorum]
MARAPGTPDITKETRQAIALYLAERSFGSHQAWCSVDRLIVRLLPSTAPKFFKERFKGLPTAKKGDHQLKSTQLELRDALLEYPPPTPSPPDAASPGPRCVHPKTSLLRYISK